MEVPEIIYKKSEFIETSSGNKVRRIQMTLFWRSAHFRIIKIIILNSLKKKGNKVSKNSVMCGSQNIILQGRVNNEMN